VAPSPRIPPVLQCVAVCCSVLQCVAVCYSALQCAAVRCSVLQYVVVCCSVLQCVAVCCSVLLCVAVCCRACVSDSPRLFYAVHGEMRHCSVLQRYSVLQRVAVACYSVAEGCSALQCVAACCRPITFPVPLPGVQNQIIHSS